MPLLVPYLYEGNIGDKKSTRNTLKHWLFINSQGWFLLKVGKEARLTCNQFRKV
jgi:hypothetical protein